jgi:hypothetical protein
MGTDINFNKSLGRTYGTYIGLPAFDPAAQAYFTATGITGVTQQAAINNLVKGLKTDGIWSKMKAVYPFVTDNRNLLSYTTTFINSNYNTDNTATFTLNNTTAPDGTNTGVRFTAVGSNNNYFYSANTIGGNNFGAGNKAFSIYVKAGTFSGSASIAITSDGSNSASVIALTNDWQRITVTKNVIVAGNNSQYFIDMSGISMTSGQYFYIWAPQFENGTTATTYQPIATTQQAFIASQFKFNLVNPVDSDAAFRLVFNGGWTHSSNGATPNGTNGYADTKLNATGNLTNNNMHLSYYARNYTASVTGKTLIGSVVPASNSAVALNWSSIAPFYYPTMQEFTFPTISPYPSVLKGLHIGRRINSTQEALFINATKYETTQASNNLIPNNTFYLGSNHTLVAQQYTDVECSFSSIGDGLTDTDASKLYTRVQTFNQALGRQVGVPIVSDADAQAFLNSAEITDLTQANAINTLVTDLKTQGLWTKMKAIYPFVGGTASTHKWNLKDPRDLDAAYRLVFNGGWTHSSNGATPNGTNGYADTKLVPSSVLTTSSAHFSKYNRTNDLVNFKLDGSYTISNSTLFQHNYTSANGCIGQATSTATYTATNTQGLFTATRIATNAFKVFKNTSNIASNTTSITAMPNSSVYIGARNEDGVSPGFYNSYQAAFASIGDGLNDTEAAALYTAVQTYQTTLNRQV